MLASVWDKRALSFLIFTDLFLFFEILELTKLHLTRNNFQYRFSIFAVDFMSDDSRTQRSQYLSHDNRNFYANAESLGTEALWNGLHSLECECSC